MSYRFIPLPGFRRHAPGEMRARAQTFLETVRTRRTVRDFAPEAPPREVIEDAIRAAATAPSGANQQPWHFVIVSDPGIKRKLREAAEAEERAFYDGRASDEWLEALAPLGTDAQKPFLETAPYLVVVFQQNYGIGPEGEKIKHYYAPESVGIATGLLIGALTHAGVATLTHTPSPMGFLREILGRPAHEKPVMILVCGYPAADAKVPDISKKPFAEICSSRD